MPLRLPVFLTVYIPSWKSNGFRMYSDAKIVFLNHVDVGWLTETQAPKNAKVSQSWHGLTAYPYVCATHLKHTFSRGLFLKHSNLRDYAAQGLFTHSSLFARDDARANAHLYFLFILSELISERRI